MCVWVSVCVCELIQVASLPLYAETEWKANGPRKAENWQIPPGISSTTWTRCHDKNCGRDHFVVVDSRISHQAGSGGVPTMASHIFSSPGHTDDSQLYCFRFDYHQFRVAVLAFGRGGALSVDYM